MASLQTLTHSEKPLDMTQLFSTGSFTGKNGVTLPYRLYVPQDYTKEKSYPMILFMHGAGERGNDNQTQLLGFVEPFRHDNAPIYQCIVLAPQCPFDKKWVNVPRWQNYRTEETPESAEIQVAIELFQTVRDTYSVDLDRVYCTGLSMGGFATWDMAVRHPELFCAIAPVCGNADDSKAAILQNMPIWTFHGDEDPTVPIEGTTRMVEALRQAGNKQVKYDVMQGRAHNIWNPTYAKPELFDWLLLQKRS